MMKEEWDQITSMDVYEAVKGFDETMPKHPSAKTTFLIVNDRLYPAKHIRGMAYEVHFGREIKKSDYTGGIETIKFFQNLGFKTKHTK